MSRIFVSYRSADGADKATALARDLGAAFGAEQVFLDKEDLRGGSAWREEITRTLDRRPVLLVLMTPMYLGARHPDGRLRIEDEDDPVRLEFAAALQVGALVIPLLCDGLEQAPDARTLPAPFDAIGERTWRKLRAYDWAADLQRLCEDLEAAGIPRRARARAPGSRGQRGWWMAGAAATAAVAGVLLHAAFFAGPRGAQALPSASPTLPIEPTAAGRPAIDLSGEWTTSGSTGPRLTLLIRHEGDRITLTSRAVSVASRPDWQQYRAFWQERTGEQLDEVVYRGEGTAVFDPVLPAVLDAAIQVVSPSGAGPLDGGNLHLNITADGRQMRGELWLNSEQAAEPVVLVRGR